MVRFFLISLLLTTSSSSIVAQWHSFRSGGASTIQGELPIQWSPKQGIAWRTEIPGYGQSSPVIWGSRVYLTSTDGPWQEKCLVHAFDLNSGQLLWTKKVKATTKVENYFRNSRAAPTCCVDASAIYSLFASGDVTAMDHQGNQRWSVPLFKKYDSIKNERGLASSLAQTNDSLFALVDHDGPSYLVAFEKNGGTIRWKTERGKRIPSWSSPVVVKLGKRELIVTSSSDSVDAYDARSGKHLWQLDGLQGNHIPSVSALGDKLFVGSNTMFHGASDDKAVAGSNCCIQLLDQGDSFKVLWSTKRAHSYYSTPLAFAGYVYYVNKVGVLFCIDQKTGQEVFAKRIGNPCWASGIGVTTAKGEQRVYLFTKNGFTSVLKSGPNFERLARNQLYDADELIRAREAARNQRRLNKVPASETTRTTGPEKLFADLPETQLHRMFSYGDPIVYGVAATEKQILIRTGQALYCVGTSRPATSTDEPTTSAKPTTHRGN